MRRKMEGNICETNHLDADVLLPPRKRLLAGLKRKNRDGNFAKNLNSSTLSEFDIRLNNLLRCHLSNTNMSNEEIIEASQKAAEAAVRVAKAARAAAEEKAVIASNAMAAAKKALESVAIVDDETDSNEIYSRKNKPKKHVRVKLLYNKNNGKTDEEIARKLHQTINSSPRIIKNSSTSELKSKKQKRPKIFFDTTRFLNGVMIQSNGNGVTHDVDFERSVQEGNMVRVDENTSKFKRTLQLTKNSASELKTKKPRPAIFSDTTRVLNGVMIQSNGNGIGHNVGPEGSVQGGNMVRVDENTSKFRKADVLEMGKGDSVKIDESLDDRIDLGRKRGRIKQKKLPLSVCNFRDQTNPKEDLKGKKPLFHAGGPSGDNVIPVENTVMWKCKSFKATTSIKQNKIMQS